MSKVFFDTNLFIYLFEEDATYGSMVMHLLDRMDRRGDELVTSWMTAAELQVKPMSLGYVDLCSKYRETLQQISSLVPFGEQASDAYLNLRATTNVRGPDAIQLACAAAANVELFVTNDHRLQKLAIPGVHFITSIERVPF